MTREVTVRETIPGDLPAVLGVLDAAGLATDVDRVRARLDRDDVLVAVPEARAAEDPGVPGAPGRRRDEGGGGRDPVVVGALVLAGEEITAVAVRRRRRDQGIGTALVEAAADRRTALLAEFDADVRPFYESLGFTVEPVDGDRYRGRLETDED